MWLAHGEDDLKFLYTRVRRRKNISSSSLVASDDLIVRQDSINSIISHFENLFNAPHPVAFTDPLPIPKGNVIPLHLSSLLTGLVSDEEIKAAIFAGSSTSSPGPDGFNFEFYKSSWLITGPLICKAVKSFFAKGYLPNKVKASAIALIPKFAHASNISDFRPIALCNVFYKIISKILASRMKDIMPFIIGNNQGGFIKNRIATDNILLASEILLDFKLSAKMKLLCAKLDIRKAFDSVSRDFILVRMKQKGFPPQFINWIKVCISDIHFSICIDGALEGYFHSSSGIRQGCPLSPYLFCIAMDAFSCMIDNPSSNDRFIGIQRKEMALTHLLYADDLLIFGEASSLNCTVLMGILDSFAKMSGLLVNHEKSKLIISKAIPNTLAVCEALNLNSLGDKMTYLGIPISVKKLCSADFQPLLNSISNHLAGWKARLLSIAGRLQYIKYTIYNTISYWIRGTILPKSCIKSLCRMCSRFLFFGDSGIKKLQLISWKRTCRPKHLGGLGIPDLASLQFANSCSLVFRFYNSKSILFDFLYAKYGTPWTPAHCNVSNTWREIERAATQITSKIQNSNGTLFWHNRRKASFSSFINFFHREDSMVDWYKYVWHKHYALKYSIYSWIAINNGLKTADELIKRSIIVPSTCSLCFSHPETNCHLMFECDYSFTVLHNLIPMVGDFLLRPRLRQVINFLGEQTYSGKKQKELLLLTACCATYYLWRERNERKFNFKFRNTSSLCLVIKYAVEAKISSWKHSENLITPWHMYCN
ncbi:Putative ribonuclease H protein [Dendrobium catenatum]|uniref:Ribonuclease H protein n=1 Tax=Dendrobium catenatum TaxID=906689 RepID=A0A2I0VLI2_9ASPA|nr:Putative ribonuclease H protein [Dendrobium catenatum]